MNQRTQVIILILFVLLISLFKGFLVADTPYPNYDAYYGVRQVESILDGSPLTTFDPLSYQGRAQVQSTPFYLLVSLFALLFPIIWLFKYLSILFSALAIVGMFFIGKKIFKNEYVVLLLTLFAGLSPSLFTTYLNTLQPGSLYLLLYIVLIYLFLHLKERSTAFLLVFMLATIISPFSLLFAIGLCIYLAITRIESLSIKKEEFEVALFALVFALWYHLVSYKSLLQLHGSSLLVSSVPATVLQNSFENITPALAIIFIGLVPVILGLYGTYAILFEKRRRSLLFVVGQLLVWSVVLWLGIIPTQAGLVYASVSLILLSGYGLESIFELLKKTIVLRFQPLLLLGIVIVAFFSFLPTLALDDTFFTDAPSREEVQVLEQAANLPSRVTIFGDIHHGHLIAAMSGKKNFFDENYFLAPQAQQRYKDGRRIMLSRSQSSSMNILHLYGVEYIYMTPQLQKTYDVSDGDLGLQSCLEPVLRRGEVVLYKVTCQI
jgi:hypothetical protein